MIKNSKQQWEIGQQVNVGFLKGLTVLAKIMTPGDYAPDAYVLAKGTAYYSFVPHNGLTRIDQSEAAAMIEEGKRIQGKIESKMKADAAAWADAQQFQMSVLAGAA